MFTNLYAAYVPDDTHARNSLPTPAKTFAQLARQMAHGQLELWALSCRRTQAYLEIPARLSRCNSPQALAREQARFMQQASRQYAETNERLVKAMNKTLAIPAATAREAAEVHVFTQPDRTPAPKSTTSVNTEVADRKVA